MKNANLIYKLKTLHENLLFFSHIDTKFDMTQRSLQKTKVDILLNWVVIFFKLEPLIKLYKYECDIVNKSGPNKTNSNIILSKVASKVVIVFTKVLLL